MSTYWQQRVADAATRQDAAIAKALPELLSHMQDARRLLEKEVNAFYARYATNNKITLAEAQKALSLSELADFKGDLKAFKKLAKQSIGTFNLEVENLSVKARVTRLEALLAQCDAVLQNGYQQQRAVIEGTAGALAQEQYLHALYDVEQYTSFQFPFSQLSSGRIAKMLAMPVQGVDISSSLWRQEFDAGHQIRRMLNNMFTTGRPPQDFAKELQRIIGRRDAEGNLTGKTYEAYRLLYNEASHVSEQAKLAAYEDDDIEELAIDTTLDSKTCHDCSPRDGEVVKVEDAVEGETVPPFHVNCRCTTVPYIPEAQGAFNSTRAARDPETGKTVRVKAESYKDWRAGLEERLGSDKLGAAEKMSKNEGADFRQYEKYKGILGKDAPKSFASFQDLKYNNTDNFVVVKRKFSDRNLQNHLASDRQPKTIESGKQGKHILGHNNYQSGKSYLTITEAEAQELVNKYAGTGEILRDANGKWRNQELIHGEKTIGFNVDNLTGEETATTDFKIHYSKKGTHIVPKRRK